MIPSQKSRGTLFLLATSLFWSLAVFLEPPALQAQEGVQVPTSELDQAYARWNQVLADKRAKASKGPGLSSGLVSGPAGSTSGPGAGAPSSAPGGGENFIEIAGKRVAVKSSPAAQAADSKTEDATAGEVAEASLEAGTGEVLATTETAVAPPASAPAAAEPSLVTIKVAKLVGGKIVEVEVQVTPTPGPAPNPQAAAGAKVGQATGQTDSLRDRLAKAAKSAKPVHFDQKSLQSLLREFMAAQKKPGFETSMPANRAQVLQAKLQRLSAMAQGGDLPQAPAQALMQALYPMPKPGTPPPPPPQGGPQAGAPPPLPSPQQPVVQEAPQVFYDPNTGEYIYEDGSPAPVPEGVVYEEVGGQEN